MTTIRSHKLRIERDKDGSKIGKCHMHGIRKRNIWMCIGALSDDFVYERVCDEVFERWTGWHDCACLYPCVRVYMYVCVWCVHVPKYACIVCERQFLSMLNVATSGKRSIYVAHTIPNAYTVFFVVVSLNKEHFYIRCMTKCLNLIINECGWHFFSRHQNKHTKKL